MTFDMMCSLTRLGRVLTDLTVGKIVGSISEISANKDYNVNNKVDESFCGLLALETDLNSFK